MTEWRCCRITGNKLFGVEPLLVGLLAIVSAARRVAGCLEAKDCAMMHMHLGAGYRFYAASKGANDPHKASQSANVLHVIYINTSLETKGISSSIIPTITCMSSNVIKTILQALTQISPNLKIFYGPDNEFNPILKQMTHVEN